MALRSWSKNRKAAATSRRCRELQKRSILMSQHCQTTSRHSGLVFGQFLAHFEPIIVGFKAQTQMGLGITFLVGLEGGKHPRAWFSLRKKMD